MEEGEQHHLLVGTEVSAKYRGAFCEAKIKSVKKSLIFKVSNKKDGKVHNVFEDAIKGSLKIGSTVEVQLPEANGWHEVVLLSAKDKSSYTVEFDDGDVRTLSRGSLCLQGVRHFAEGDTLDQLPLTDPENFGTPVLNSKRKTKRKVTQTSIDHDDIESDDQKPVDTEPAAKKKTTQSKIDSKDDPEEESDERKREKWLADRRMGKLVLIEPTDKRKHWYPAVCVNPMCVEEYDEVENGHLVVRSFKSGKFFTVARCERLTRSNPPSKVEPVWKDVLESSFLWEETGTVPDVWKADLSDDESLDKIENNEDGDKQDNEKRRDFLEQLYKFMEDRGTPITKAPVLGYKDLDLFLLYNLVRDKGGFHRIVNPGDWREIYSELGIPKITQAAGHHAKMAYSKYLLCFEEYIISFQRKNPRHESSRSSSGRKIGSSTPNKSPRRVEESDTGSRRASRRRKVSESLCVVDETEIVHRETKRPRKSKAEKRDSDFDDSSSTAGSDKCAAKSKEPAEPEKPKQCGGKRLNNGTAAVKKPILYKIGDRVKVKYGKGSLFPAKVMDMKIDESNDQCYLVHYTGYNSRHDEWIKASKISGLQNDASVTPKSLSRRPKSPMSEDKLSDVFPAVSNAGSPVEQCKPEPPVIAGPEVSCDTTKSERSKPVKEFQEKSDSIEKRKRIRRRSTSSSTPPPLHQLQPTSPKRAASAEKVVLEKQEIKSSSVKEESNFSDDKQEKAPPSGVPTGLFPVARRTSGRRSKSPAYLKESALYGLTKRKRNPSAPNEPQTNLESDPPADMDDLSSESSSKSFNSSTTEASRSSPLTIWSEQDQMDKNRKSERKRGKTKLDEQKLTQIEEERFSLANSAEYDNFDEDVPSIELEKSGDSGRKKSKSSSHKVSNAACDEEDAGGTENDGNDQQDQRESDIKTEDSNENTSPSTDSSDKSNEQSDDAEAAQDESASPDIPTSRSAPPPDIPSSRSTPPPSEIPSSSKALMDNTPPSTPEGSLKKFSDEIDSGSTSRSPSSSGEDCTTFSPEQTDLGTSPEDENPGKQTADDVNEKNADDDKFAAGSDSDGEVKSKQKKNNKKKNKKKKRPEPPTAPSPLQADDLAALTPDERIQVMLRRMDELRKAYQQLKQEVSWIDRKRKRAKRREQEAAEQSIKKVSSPHKAEVNDAVNDTS